MNHLENAKKRLKDSLLNLEELIEARMVELRHFKGRCKILEQENQQLIARLRELSAERASVKVIEPSPSSVTVLEPANSDANAVQQEISLSISELKNFIGQKHGNS
jgi:hypothetical protein